MGRRAASRAPKIVIPVGRFALGSAAVYLAVTDFGSPEWELSWYAPVLGFLVAPLLIVGAQ